MPALDFMMFNCSTRKFVSNIVRGLRLLRVSDTVGRRLGVLRCSPGTVPLFQVGSVDVHVGPHRYHIAVFPCTTTLDGQIVGSGSTVSV
jgi:hypothetical protein